MSQRIPKIGETWTRKTSYIEEKLTLLAYDEKTKSFFVRVHVIFTDSNEEDTYTDSYPLEVFESDDYAPPVDKSKDFTSFVNVYGAGSYEPYCGQVTNKFEKAMTALKCSIPEIQERYVGTLEFGIRDGERYVKFVEESE